MNSIAKQCTAVSIASIVCASSLYAGETTTYTYDALGRVTDADRSGTVNNNVDTDYEYDELGNRKRVKITGGIQETLTLPTAASGATSATSLINGAQYSIEVSGVADIGVPADAEYYTVDNWATFVDVNPNHNLDMGVSVDGVKLNWGSTSDIHMYSATITGDGTSIYLKYEDTYYGDNAGSLTVRIRKL